MIPVLLAEESLRETERLAVGTGAASAEDRRMVLRQWREEAGRDSRPCKRLILTPEAMAGMGIGYHKESRG